MLKRARSEMQRNAIEGKSILDNSAEPIATGKRRKTKKSGKGTEEEDFTSPIALADLSSSDDDGEDDSEDDSEDDEEKETRAIENVETTEGKAEGEGEGESKNDDDKEEEKEEEKGEEKKEERLEYACNICPHKQLKTELDVEVHLKSKHHIKKAKKYKISQRSPELVAKLKARNLRKLLKRKDKMIEKHKERLAKFHSRY